MPGNVESLTGCACVGFLSSTPDLLHQTLGVEWRSLGFSKISRGNVGPQGSRRVVPGLVRTQILTVQVWGVPELLHLLVLQRRTLSNRILECSVKPGTPA